MPAGCVTPVAWTDSTMGMTWDAKVAALSLADRRPIAPAASMLLLFPSGTPWSFFAARAAVVRCEISLPLLLGEGGVQVQHERVGIDPTLRDDEGYPLSHPVGDESDIARERSSLATTAGHFSVFALASAAAGVGGG